jgi:hypothetical protein
MIKMQDTVLRCCQKVARSLLEHKNNNIPRDTFTNKDSKKRSIEDEDARNNKKAKMANENSVCLLLPSTHL